MARVLAESVPGTVVVFDIDNTLLAPVGHLGSDEWYDYLCERGVARGETRATASRKADDAFNRWQTRVKVRPVDSAAPAVIAELHRRGLTVFALTARSAGAREVTLSQLDSLHLDMDNAPFVGKEAAFTEKLGAGTAYKNGVFFIGEGGLTKGEALVRILDTAGLKPVRVVFVDDKPRHTVTVDASLSEHHIPHLCLRFSRKDAEVAAFRQDMAHLAELDSGNGN